MLCHVMWHTAFSVESRCSRSLRGILACAQSARSSLPRSHFWCSSLPCPAMLCPTTGRPATGHSIQALHPHSQRLLFHKASMLLHDITCKTMIALLCCQQILLRVRQHYRRGLQLGVPLLLCHRTKLQSSALGSAMGEQLSVLR